MNSMNFDSQDDIQDPLDRAIAARLAKLRAMPVDTSRLEAAIRAKIPKAPAATVEAQRPRRIRWFSPLRALAASFVLLCSVVAIVLLTSSSGPAMASASEMAQMHRDIVDGRVPVMRVQSI